MPRSADVDDEDAIPEKEDFTCAAGSRSDRICWSNALTSATHSASLGTSGGTFFDAVSITRKIITMVLKYMNSVKKHKYKGD